MTNTPSTASLELLFKGHELYLAIKDPHGRASGYLRNFAVYDANRATVPLVIHATSFGGPDFYRHIKALSPQKRKHYFMQNVSATLLQTISDESASHASDDPIRQADSGGRAGDSGQKAQKAQDIAWLIFNQVSDPYTALFKNAKINASKAIAAQADPIALATALNMAEPYKIFVAQSNTINTFDDVLRTKERGLKVAHARIEANTRHLYFSVGRKYPLTATPDQVTKQLAHMPGYDHLLQDNVSHEFGHLVNMEHMDQKHIQRRRLDLRLALISDKHNAAALLTDLLRMLGNEAKSQPPVKEAEIRNMLHLRGKNPNKISPRTAYRILHKDINFIAQTLAPGLSFEETRMRPFFTDHTKTLIANKNLYYDRQQLRMAELHACMHELASHYPREFLERLFPKAMGVLREDGQTLYEANLQSVNDIGLLKSGKPILIQGPARFIRPKSDPGTSRS